MSPTTSLLNASFNTFLKSIMCLLGEESNGNLSPSPSEGSVPHLVFGLHGCVTRSAEAGHSKAAAKQMLQGDSGSGNL